jgi:hypothetical protein
MNYEYIRHSMKYISDKQSTINTTKFSASEKKRFKVGSLIAFIFGSEQAGGKNCKKNLLTKEPYIYSSKKLNNN